MKEFRFDWREMSPSQKKEVYNAYRKTANRRLRRIRESGYKEPFETADYLDRIGRKFFPNITSSYVTELNSAITAVESFLNLKSSTVTGIKSIAHSVKENMKEYHRKYANNPDFKLNIDDRNLINFLHSSQFRHMRSRVDSYKLIEDFTEWSSKADTAEIFSEYERFINNEIDYREVERVFEG